MPSSSAQSSESEAALRYLASRMMGDMWIARKLARELSSLPLSQQVERLRAFLAAATVGNTVAAEICKSNGIITGITITEKPKLRHIGPAGGIHQPNSQRKISDKQEVTRYYADQLLSQYQSE